MADKTQRLLNKIKQTTPKVTPIGTDMVLPNHSGIASHPEAKKTFWITDTDQTGLTGDKTGTFNLTTTGEGGFGGLMPYDSATYDLGSVGLRWRNLILSGDITTLGNITATGLGTFGNLRTGNLSVTGQGYFSREPGNPAAIGAGTLTINSTGGIENGYLLEVYDNDDEKFLVRQDGLTLFKGAAQHDNTLTVGVDDTGYDVKFFGATIGGYMEWDESENVFTVRSRGVHNIYPYAYNLESSAANTYLMISNDGGTAAGAFFGMENAGGGSGVGDIFNLYNWQGGPIQFTTSESGTASNGTTMLTLGTTTREIIIGAGRPGVDYQLRFNGQNSDGIIQWMEDEDEFRFEDDIVFTGDAGLPFAEIYARDNAATTSTSTTKTQILIFDTNGESNKMTPDHANDHILVLKPGKYKIDASISIKNSSGAAHVISLEMYKNNGTVVFNNIHAGRTLGTGSDVGNLTMSGIVDLAAEDTLEFWITSDSAAARTVTVEDIDFCAIQIGGT